MIDQHQLRDLIIKPTLQYLDPTIPYSEAAVELLMMTCAHESHLGTYIKQVNGPALGIYQMEPATHTDIWNNFLKYKNSVSEAMMNLAFYVHYSIAEHPFEDEVHPDELVSNLSYATAMARVHYYRDSQPLPDVSDIKGLAKYAKRVYNTHEGKASWKNYFTSYERYC